MIKELEMPPLREEDLELVRAWRNSSEVKSYMYTDQYISEEDQLNWFNKIKDDKTQKYWLIKYGGQPIGLASLSGISKVFDSCKWAFYLGDTSIRGAGIGSRIEMFVIKYVFDELGLNKLRCEVLVRNDKVIKMHEKFGFRREAYFRQHVFKEGVYLDVVELALLKSEWQTLAPVFAEKFRKYTKQ